MTTLEILTLIQTVFIGLVALFIIIFFYYMIKLAKRANNAVDKMKRKIEASKEMFGSGAGMMNMCMKHCKEMFIKKNGKKRKR